MIEVLELFGPAREHFKTLYYRWELVNLSRALFYISVPALIIVGIMLMHVGPHTFTGSTLGVDNLSWVAAAGYTIGVAPFMILLSYILRIATLTQPTLSMGPFILRKSKREDDIDWSS